MYNTGVLLLLNDVGELLLLCSCNTLVSILHIGKYEWQRDDEFEGSKQRCCPEVESSTIRVYARLVREREIFLKGQRALHACR